MNNPKTYKLWTVKVQENKKPFGFEKEKLLAEVDQTIANKIFEKSIKHVHINVNVLWMSATYEKQYDVPADTYVYLEDFIWGRIS